MDDISDYVQMLIPAFTDPRVCKSYLTVIIPQVRVGYELGIIIS